jgi:CBS domain containing-hemolysin-like protein
MDGALPILPGLLLLAALLALNALFVAAEFAFVTVRRTQLQHLASQGDGRARYMLGALQNLDFYVAASQLGITMATIAIGFLGEPVLAGLIEPPVEDLVGPFAPALSHTIAVIAAFAVATALHIVVGEFVPKSIALAQPNGTSLWLAYPMDVFVRIFRPMIWLLNETGNALLRLIGVNLRPISDEPLRPEDIAFSLETSASAGLISRRELDLTRNTLRLSTITASDLMVPRNAIVAIPEDAGSEDVRRIFATHRFTRYPVYRDSLDDIVGVVDIKDAVFDLSREADWRAEIEAPLLLPETITVENALAAAERAQASLMVLVDEFGGTAGILSVYDVVQYLAGGLPEEYRVDSPEIEPGPDSSFVVSGLLPLVEFQDEFDIALPDVDSHTVGGLVAELLQRIPDAGDEVEFDGARLRVLDVARNRVERLMVLPDDGDDNEEDASER